MKEHKIIELTESDKIEVRSRKKFPFEKMANNLVSGGNFFLPSVDRRTASYVRRKLENMLDTLIDTTYGFYTPPEGGEKIEGYTFSFNLAKEYFKKVFEKEKEQK